MKRRNSLASRSSSTASCGGAVWSGGCPGDQTVSLIRAVHHSSPPERLLMTGLSAPLTAPSLNGGAAWNHRRGWENDSLWTPGLFVKASFAPIKVDPVPGGG